MQKKYFQKYFTVQKDVAVLLQLLGTGFIWAATGGRDEGERMGSKAPAFPRSAAVQKGEDYLTLHFSSLCETRGTRN